MFTTGVRKGPGRKSQQLSPRFHRDITCLSWCVGAPSPILGILSYGHQIRWRGTGPESFSAALPFIHVMRHLTLRPTVVLAAAEETLIRFWLRVMCRMPSSARSRVASWIRSSSRRRYGRQQGEGKALGRSFVPSAKRRSRSEGRTEIHVGSQVTSVLAAAPSALRLRMPMRSTNCYRSIPTVDLPSGRCRRRGCRVVIRSVPALPPAQRGLPSAGCGAIAQIGARPRLY